MFYTIAAMMVLAVATEVSPAPTPAASPAPPADDTMQVVALLKQARETYAALNSYEDTGTVSALVGTFLQEATFTIRLQRQSYYRVTWTGGMTGGAAWSDGTGDYLRLPGRAVEKQKDREAVLAGATGVSTGAAATIPASFFHENWGGVLNGIGVCHLLPDETVDGVPCHVITSLLQSHGQTINTTLWLGQQDHLIHQFVRTSKGASVLPKLDDALLAKVLQAENKPVTPEALAALREQMAAAQSIANKMMVGKGITFTENHRAIATNKTYTPADFQPAP
jgi:hypothetical protein